MRRGVAVQLTVWLGFAGVLLALVSAPALAGPPPAISAVGNQLQAAGQTLQLRGVNRGAYTECDGNAVYDSTFAGAPYDDPNDDFADGPVNQWSVAVMASWGINAVRIPVNESCWLGDVSGSPSQCESYAPETCQTAAGYRQEVENYVNLLVQNGLYVVLSLQYTAPPGYASGLQVDHYPDAAETPVFWQQAAQAFGGDPDVLFDLVSESAASPYNGPCTNGMSSCPANNYADNWTDSEIWDCWLEGCSNVPSLFNDTNGNPVDYSTLGMQSLIDDVRNDGAANPIIIDSPDYSLGYNEDDCSAKGSFATGSQSCWSVYAPTDPDHDMIFDAHLYDFDMSGAASGTPQQSDATESQEQLATSEGQSYLENDIEPVAKQYPVMLGELGESDCSASESDAPFVPSVLDDDIPAVASATGQSLSVLAWTWDADSDDNSTVSSGWYCPTGEYGIGGPPLISDYDGAPTPMGQVFENWFVQKDPVTPPSPPPAPTPAPVATSTPTPTPASTPAPSSAASPTPATPAAPVAATVDPGARTIPHIQADGATLACVDGDFSGAAGATVTYAWYVAGRRIAGPDRADTLAASHAVERSLECAETVAVAGASATATSHALPVPGRPRLNSAGQASVEVICPASGRQVCVVTLTLASRARRPAGLGSSRVRLRAGRTADVTLALSATGRQRLDRARRLEATLTATESVAGLTQIIARQDVTLLG